MEWERVIAHFTIIYETRDRFFRNFMSVSLAMYGVLGFVVKEPSRAADLMPFAMSMLITLIVFGVATLFVVSANWLARDFYRQRRALILEILWDASVANIEEGWRRYLQFTRDKTEWHFRPTSLYFIYNTAIALSNGIAVVFAFHFTVQRLTPFGMSAAVVSLILVQHLCMMMYLWTYRRGHYPEGEPPSSFALK
jgi:hypothetical protein